MVPLRQRRWGQLQRMEKVDHRLVVPLPRRISLLTTNHRRDLPFFSPDGQHLPDVLQSTSGIQKLVHIQNHTVILAVQLHHFFPPHPGVPSNHPCGGSLPSLILLNLRKCLVRRNSALSGVVARLPNAYNDLRHALQNGAIFNTSPTEHPLPESP